MKIYTYVVGILPFWWRFWQCIHKTIKSGNKWQLVNAAKYMSKIVPTVTLILGSSKTMDFSTTYKFYFGSQVFTTLFCLYWDYKWDWGLFRGTRKDNWYLRDRMKFQPSFYITLMILNFLFRLWWIVPTLSLDITNTLPVLSKFQILVFIGMLVEAVRRGLWSIVRVENEFYNNLEQYRTILTIPPIREEADTKRV